MMIPSRPKHKRPRRVVGFVLTFVMVAATSCSSELEGNGEEATEQRMVTAFDHVDVDDGAEVTLTIDPSATGDVRLAVATDSNLIEFLATRVTDGELRVSPDRAGGMSTDLGFDVSGTVANMDSVTVDNGASATINGSAAEATLIADNGASINGDGFETTAVSVDVDNGAHITICATGPVTGTTTNGAELTIRCGGDVSRVEATDGGRVITAP